MVLPEDCGSTPEEVFGNSMVVTTFFQGEELPPCHINREYLEMDRLELPRGKEIGTVIAPTRTVKANGKEYQLPQAKVWWTKDGVSIGPRCPKVY